MLVEITAWGGKSNIWWSGLYDEMGGLCPPCGRACSFAYHSAEEGKSPKGYSQSWRHWPQAINKVGSSARLYHPHIVAAWPMYSKYSWHSLLLGCNFFKLVCLPGFLVPFMMVLCFIPETVQRGINSLQGWNSTRMLRTNQCVDQGCQWKTRQGSCRRCKHSQWWWCEVWRQGLTAALQNFIFRYRPKLWDWVGWLDNLGCHSEQSAYERWLCGRMLPGQFMHHPSFLLLWSRFLQAWIWCLYWPHQSLMLAINEPCSLFFLHIYWYALARFIFCCLYSMMYIVRTTKLSKILLCNSYLPVYFWVQIRSLGRSGWRAYSLAFWHRLVLLLRSSW